MAISSKSLLYKADFIKIVFRKVSETEWPPAWHMPSHSCPPHWGGPRAPLLPAAPGPAPPSGPWLPPKGMLGGFARDKACPRHRALSRSGGILGPTSPTPRPVGELAVPCVFSASAILPGPLPARLSLPHLQLGSCLPSPSSSWPTPPPLPTSPLLLFVHL